MSSVSTIVVVASSTVALYCINLYLGMRRASKDIGDHPGPRTLISISSIAGSVFPPIRGVVMGYDRTMRGKHSDFAEAGWDAFANVSAWPSPKVVLNIADAATAKEMTSSRARFPKDMERYAVLSVFGRNVVASEGEEWKRYRKVAAPAFSEKNNKLVWDETVGIMIDMFDNVWKNKQEVAVDHCVDITLPIALFVIGAAGFGRRLPWIDDLKIPPGHKMTFKDALHVASTDVFLKIILPERAMGLTARLRRTRLAFEELDTYMLEMIRARRNAEKTEERHDLFSTLLEASEDTSDGQLQITDSELIGNIFIFLVAGHETAAHTLCFTFAMLALYPKIQDRLYEEIKTLMPDLTRVPTYGEMPQYTYAMAVFYETLRMFPPAIGIPKISAEDTVLNVGNAAGETRTIPIPKGTSVAVHVPGLHYNPRYWESPYEFRPERFLGDWNKDAFLPFSAGARACLGRRFFETEGIAVMTMLMSRYKVSVKEEPQFAGETFEQRRERITANRPGLTQTPIRVPLVFKRRY